MIRKGISTKQKSGISIVDISRHFEQYAKETRGQILLKICHTVSKWSGLLAGVFGDYALF